MQATTVHLYQATDAENSLALKAEGDEALTWRASRGYGQKFQPVWTMELQSEGTPDFALVDWEAVLDRVIEAYTLSDPVITNYTWPLQERV